MLLGQAGYTLSGGEAQRLKLAKSLMLASTSQSASKRKGLTLYLFDEPSTGLHYFDILRLIDVFHSIVKRGDTVLFIEHNSSLIEAADQVVKLGPGSGKNGGELIG